jgi:PilZ domain-containing protein
MAKTHEQDFDNDRRETDRFPIENELRYKLMEGKAVQLEGRGRTCNMSSGGILFTSEARLTAGYRVELSVDWPARLNEICGLKLVAMGKIVRSDAETAAIQIEKYDFRTRAAVAVAASA